MKALSIYIGDITFDAEGPVELARFWAEALHYEVQFSSEDFAAIIDPLKQNPRCCFQKACQPKTSKNRVHLDLFAQDMEAEVERLIRLGARKIKPGQDGDVVWTVMADPEDNEFCVQPPQY